MAVNLVVYFGLVSVVYVYFAAMFRLLRHLWIVLRRANITRYSYAGIDND